MDFRLSEEQLSIQSVARDFAQKRIAPIAAELDAKGTFPLETIREMGQLGLMGIEVPAEYGGAGMDPVAYALAMIEIGAADTAHSTIMSVNNSLYCNGILQHGSEEQKQKYVRAIASGEHIGAYALTEPQSGSDASAMHTQAAKNANGDWVINGKKSWITSGPVARYIILFAITTPGIGAKGISAFIVDANTPGLAIAERIDVIAPHPLATLEFKNCRLPASALLGNPGDGFKIAMATLDIFRTTVGAAALGFARRALDEAVAYAKKREAFGKKLAEFQLIQAKIAEMAVKIDTAALLIYRSAWTKDVKQARVTRESAMAKLYATDAAQEVVDEAVQIFGGQGVVSGNKVEELYREIRALRIYEGTSEIQKLVIAGQTMAAAEA